MAKAATAAAGKARPAMRLRRVSSMIPSLWRNIGSRRGRGKAGGNLPSAGLESDVELGSRGQAARDVIEIHGEVGAVAGTERPDLRTARAGADELPFFVVDPDRHADADLPGRAIGDLDHRLVATLEPE